MKLPAFWILSMYWSAAADECRECQGETYEAKAGMAMLVKTHHVTSAAELTHSTGQRLASKIKMPRSTQGVEREASLIFNLLHSPKSELTQSTIQQLAKIRVTPETKKLLDWVFDALNPVFAELENQTKTGIQNQKALLDEFVVCKGNFEAWIEANVDPAIRHVNQTDVLHRTCRGHEKIAWDNWQACKVELSNLEIIMNNALADLKSSSDSLTGLLCVDTDYDNLDILEDNADNADDYVLKVPVYIAAEAAYKTKAIECGKNETVYTDSKDLSDDKQEYLEKTVCHWSNMSQCACEEMHSNWTVKSGDFNMSQKNIIERDCERDFEYKHLKKVECTLKALVNFSTGKETQVENAIAQCKDETFTRAFSVTKQDPPTPPPCPEVPVTPCDQEYKDEYYGDLPVPAAQCKACSGHSLPVQDLK